MRRRAYNVIDVSSCNADTTGGKSAAVIVGPLNIQEDCCFEVTFQNDASIGSAATSTIAANLQMSPYRDGPWYTRVSGNVNSSTNSTWCDINNQVGWLRVTASSTSTIGHGGLRMILSHVSKRG